MAPFDLLRPRVGAAPLLLDSPHSGRHYPKDFETAVPLADLRTAEDTHVETLFAESVNYGAALLCANYPRAYVDCNRSAEDVDELLLASPWPRCIGASEKTKLGYGLIWRRLDDGRDIYARKLSVAEVTMRIDRVYRPYWQALRAEANRLHEQFGLLYHINCHSMPSRATRASHLPFGTPHADVVLGDRDGATSEPEFVAVLEAAFRERGYSIKRNDPYKGVEIVRELGQPTCNRHSVQLEVNRALYMNEATREPSANFARVKSDLGKIIERIAHYAIEKRREVAS